MRLDPDGTKEALTLRQAGWTLSSIAEKTGASPSTLYRLFKRAGTTRGAITAESVEAAKQQIIQDADFVESLKHQIASSIIDDLQMSKRIKEQALLTLELLEADPDGPMIKARALAALATSVKVASDVQRRCLRIDDPTLTPQSDDLPTLTITRMTDEEIKLAQRRFSHESEEAMTDD